MTLFQNQRLDKCRTFLKVAALADDWTRLGVVMLIAPERPANNPTFFCERRNDPPENFQFPFIFANPVAPL
jgi:hypothetical protein